MSPNMLFSSKPEHHRVQPLSHEVELTSLAQRASRAAIQYHQNSGITLTSFGLDALMALI
jgi:hypothetical protein